MSSPPLASLRPEPSAAGETWQAPRAGVNPRQTARLVALLGVNLWATFIMVPSLYLRRGTGPVLSLLGAVPLLVLAVSAHRLSPVGLLLLYPASLVAVPAIDRALVGVNVVGLASFTITAASLCGYLFGTAYLLRRTRLFRPAQWVRPVEEPEPPRWARRRFLYRAWMLLAAPFVPVLIYAVNLRPATVEALRQRFGGRTAEVTTLMNVLICGLWLGLFATYFLAPMRADYRGDPPLRRELTELRGQVRTGRPRLVFFLGVGVALLLMVLLIWTRR